jgi:hypothetical protein
MHKTPSLFDFQAAIESYPNCYLLISMQESDPTINYRQDASEEDRVSSDKVGSENRTSAAYGQVQESEGILHAGG